MLNLIQIVEGSSYETLEALAAHISGSLLEEFHMPEITVAIEVRIFRAIITPFVLFFELLNMS